MVELDGAEGEGGGQILRSALALSMATGQPFRLKNLRAGRAKPGLLRQHLAALNAAAQISSARVEGAELGARTVRFEPGPVRAGEYRFPVGSAGSTGLVLQAVWPALALAEGDSQLDLEGGTHNPSAPPCEFLTRVLAPVVAKAGLRLEVALLKHGFYPAGGGRIRAQVFGARSTSPLELLTRGAPTGRALCAVMAGLPASSALRELAELERRLGWTGAAQAPLLDRHPNGPGNAVWALAEYAEVTECFTGFGTKGRAAEEVAREVAEEAAEYLASEAPVGRHLADQLIVPLALAKGGTFRTLSPSGHTHSQVTVVRAFLGAEVTLVEEDPTHWRVTVPGR